MGSVYRRLRKVEREHRRARDYPPTVGVLPHKLDDSKLLHDVSEAIIAFLRGPRVGPDLRPTLFDVLDDPADVTSFERATPEQEAFVRTMLEGVDPDIFERETGAAMPASDPPRITSIEPGTIFDINLDPNGPRLAGQRYDASVVSRYPKPTVETRTLEGGFYRADEQGRLVKVDDSYEVHIGSMRPQLEGGGIILASGEFVDLAELAEEAERANVDALRRGFNKP